MSKNTQLLALVVVFAFTSANALAGGPGYQGGYGHGYNEPNCKIVYETRYKTVKRIAYKKEYYTDYVEQVCEVPRKITETRYREIQDVICETVTDFRIEEVDRGCYQQQACYDAHGCLSYKKVWVPNICQVKVPYQREVKRYITKKVPYEVCRVVYDKVTKRVPVEKVKMVPYEVCEQVPYQVAKKVCCDTPHGHGAY